MEKRNEAFHIVNGRPERGAGDREKTIAYRILRAHEKKSSADKTLHIGFDALISHDITYVGIIQTARASGLTEFPLPYVLTNCHNSLCAVGGTINEDDHAFGLSAVKKYGGIYVPANLAVIHQFAREKLSGCGRMILGSDSHTRYGCYGTMGVGEGGGELAKQLLQNTWDIAEPEVVLVWLEGSVPHGVGPHDVALALTAAVFEDGFVKNRVLEFAGPGVAELPMDFRTGIDVMTTETTALSSVWITDDVVKAFYENVGRPEDFCVLSLEEGAGYDRMVHVDLGTMESMIALPFHPSRAVPIHELQKNGKAMLQKIDEETKEKTGLDPGLSDMVGEDGKIRVEQGTIVGCAGGMYDNIAEAADILQAAKGSGIGNGYFDLSVYPSSAPVNLALLRDGVLQTLAEAGAVVKPAFCGPCFGAGDVPSNNGLSMRHTTRNFPNREGSKPGDAQVASVALMDARSIAATAANGGVLTAATDVDYTVTPRTYRYEDGIYEKRCTFAFGKADPSAELRRGPNITAWPAMPAVGEDLLVRFCAVIPDEVTTTDELIPSGETSSLRSNPLKLSEFALSRRCPDYVKKSKAVHALEEARENGNIPAELQEVLSRLPEASPETLRIGSAVFAKKPGDGSAREQAASCQKVLGGFANLCYSYATKRYRSNCINWGIVPFTMPEGEAMPAEDAWLFVPGIREGILAGKEAFTGYLAEEGSVREIPLLCEGLTEEERQILADGCLINYYARGKEA